MADDIKKVKTIMTIARRPKADILSETQHYKGRMFVSTDTNEFFNDDGTDIKPVSNQFKTMPEATAVLENIVIQYIGNTTTTNPTYTQGGFYKCVKQDTNYVWVEIANPQLTHIITNNGFTKYQGNGGTSKLEEYTWDIDLTKYPSKTTNDYVEEKRLFGTTFTIGNEAKYGVVEVTQTINCNGWNHFITLKFERYQTVTIKTYECWIRRIGFNNGGMPGKFATFLKSGATFEDSGWTYAGTTPIEIANFSVSAAGANKTFTVPATCFKTIIIACTLNESSTVKFIDTQTYPTSILPTSNSRAFMAMFNRTYQPNSSFYWAEMCLTLSTTKVQVDRWQGGNGWKYNLCRIYGI